MNWFVRFLLGLPARPADINQIRRSFPEILKDPSRGSALFDFFFCHWTGLVQSKLDARQLSEWLREGSKQAHDASPMRISFDNEPCEHPDCPRRRARQLAQPNELIPLELVRIGGGPDSKPPLDSFLDCVTTVHGNAGAVKRLFVTDPYLLTNTGQDGTGGGFDNFCSYLKIFTFADEATLFIPPGPKQPSSNRSGWINAIKKTCPGIARIQSYQSKFDFHDRLYIAEHTSGAVKGVFGPSMNGLSAKAIVMFGEIEKQPLGKLASWFELDSSNRRTRRKA